MARTAISPPSNPSPSLFHPVYQFATSPDIIRSNQKDVAEISTLSSSLTDLLRRLYGSRFTQTHSSETTTLAHLLYFSLTTLIGNRTLGEEYNDIYQIEIKKKQQDLQQLPSIKNRAGYILLSVLFPYAFAKTLPTLRGWAKHVLERGLQGSNRGNPETTSISRRIQIYLLDHLSEIMSPGPIDALTLTFFYFSGSYYHLSKWLLGMRYVFSKRLSKREEDARVGYEVLGILLVVQIAVQACMHLKSIFQDLSPNLETHPESKNGEATVLKGAVNSQSRIALTTHTPLPVSEAESRDVARYDLNDIRTMTWMQSKPQRNCILCLEPMKDPSVATCGHIFCWTCVLDWVKEKAECPLCRQEMLRQHILPLRG